MRKYTLLIVVICLISNSLTAQSLKDKATVSITEKLNLTNKEQHGDVIELENGDFIAVIERNPNPQRTTLGKFYDPVGLTTTSFKNHSKYLLIARYDKDFNEIKRNEISLTFGDDRHRFDQLVLAGEEIYVFTSFEDKKEKMYYKLCQTLNQNNLTINGDFIQLIEANKEEYFTYKFSYNGSKLIFLKNIKAKKNELVEYNMQVLDAKNKFQLLWEGNFKSDQINKLEDIVNYSINDEGDAYFMVRNFEDHRKAKTKNGNPNYTFSIKEFSNNGKSENSFDLSIGDLFISDITLGINGSNDIVCTGFYSVEAGNAIKGSFYILFDSKSKKIVKKSTKEFGLDFITANLNKRKTEKAKRKAAKGKSVELPNYNLKGMVMEDDGSVIQIAERYYTVSHTYTDANGVRHTTYTYHTDEILVTRINEQGDIDWIRKIRKAQGSNSPGNIYASFHFALIGDKMYFFHNGNSENLTLDQKESVKSWRLGKKAAVIITEIDLEGYMKQDKLMDYAGYKQIPQIRGGLNLNNDDIVFYANEKKNRQYIRVSIEQ